MNRVAATIVAILVAVLIVVTVVASGAALNRAVPDSEMNLHPRTGPPPTAGTIVGDDWYQKAVPAAGTVSDAYLAIAFHAGRGDAEAMASECSRIANSYLVRQATETLVSAPNPQVAAIAATWSTVFYEGMRACANGDIDTSVRQFQTAAKLLIELETSIEDQKIV